jgi:hypothetical protein
VVLIFDEQAICLYVALPFVELKEKPACQSPKDVDRSSF